MNQLNLEKSVPCVTEIIDGQDRRVRPGDWIGIVIHHTGLGDRREITDSLWRTLQKNIAAYLARKDDVFASAHFQIGRFGEITQIVNPDHYIAFHAGVSTFWHPVRRKFVSGMNDFAIGIELLGDGNVREYSEAQYEALGRLCAELLERFPTIQPHCITGHEVVSPGRKSDPGKLFDWRKAFAAIYRHA